MTVKAIYQDSQNNRFSGLVVRTNEGWRIQTDSGTRPIDFYIEEPSAIGGICEFVDYEVCPEQRLRPADVIPFINSVRATLPLPQKPAEPPKVKADPADGPLHVDPSDGDSFQQIQMAGARDYAQRLTERERQRRAIIESSQRNRAQLAQVARQQRNEIAQAYQRKLETNDVHTSHKSFDKK